MSKKNKPLPPQKSKTMPVQDPPIISRRGKIIIGLGIFTVAAGFYIVTLTDPLGQNWASNLCPFVILGGYALIGVGIVLPDPLKSS